MVFRDLSLKCNPIASNYFKSVLNRLSYWIGNLQNSVKVGDERSTLIFCGSKISFVVVVFFFLFLLTKKLYSMIFSLKSYLILCAKRNGSKSKIFFLS